MKAVLILFFAGVVMGQSISGVYEVCIGAIDEKPLIAYFERFGYRVGESGNLNEEAAEALYGVRSKLRSIRLYHQDADHGLIRIMVWDKPLNEGLGLASMRVIGNRWGAMMTADIYNIQNHTEEAIAQGYPIRYVPPQRAEIYKLEKRPIPFLENYAVVREMCLIQPLTRQIIFQRFGYELPFYGKINPNSFFKSSQITHFGLVVYRNQENIDFYGEVLGLLKVRESSDYESGYEDASARAIFELEKHQRYGVTDFDNPKSSKDPMKALSGRLKIIWFSPESKLDNKLDYSRPGSLGYSLYTYNVNGIDFYHQKVKSSKAQNVTDILRNEFGEKSFTFVAPDGYFWNLIER
ncbi:MAG: VOC family protein [Pyrinomonadaceae bacterium]|nr:VOC family protein [Pyrinomonadaceae bacterium]MCX7638867.1 VOC family protein [Pyrinomonadaceae bacterium]MDW8304997.1 VOC family protein [Acidobacteriota bacterium]